MFLWILYAALFGFAFGFAGRPLTAAIGTWWDRRRAALSWKRFSKGAPWKRPGTRIEAFQASMRKIVPGLIDVTELNLLFDQAWGSPKPRYGEVLDHSFGWVAFRDNESLRGFANVAWDGGGHFFLLDTTVHPDYRHDDVARDMVRAVIDMCRGKGDWLHVDASEVLMQRLYFPCGFQPTAAGLVDLRAPGESEG